MTMKYTEDAIPANLRLVVHHLHEGKCSRNQLKKLGRTNTKYVTIAKLKDKDTNFTVAKGMAACSSKDNPQRKLGRHVAVGRALAQYYSY